MTLPKRGNKMGNDERIAVLETTINHIDASLIGITQELRRLNERIDSFSNRMDGKFDSIDGKFNYIEEKLDKKFDKLNDRLWTLFFWMIAGFASILGIMAHGFHWV